VRAPPRSFSQALVVERSRQQGAANLLIRRAHLQCGYTLSKIAAYLDIHYTTVSKVVNETSEN
jgi:hypothetical protein